MTTLDEHATALLACPYCQADPGERCTTVTGRRATYVHGGRTDAVRVIYLDGFRDGITDAVAWIKYARAHGHTLAQVEAQLTPWLRDLEDR